MNKFTLLIISIALLTNSFGFDTMEALKDAKSKDEIAEIIQRYDRFIPKRTPEELARAQAAAAGKDESALSDVQLLESRAFMRKKVIESIVMDEVHTEKAFKYLKTVDKEIEALILKVESEPLAKNGDKVTVQFSPSEDDTDYLVRVREMIDADLEKVMNISDSKLKYSCSVRTLSSGDSSAIHVSVYHPNSEADGRATRSFVRSSMRMVSGEISDAFIIKLCRDCLESSLGEEVKHKAK